MGAFARALLVPAFGIASVATLNAQLPPLPPPIPALIPGTALLCASATLPAPAAASRFDVVSIKPSPGGATGFRLTNRPDGAFMMVNGTLSMLISRGYAGQSQILGLPDWAESLRFDVNATVAPGTSPPTPEQRCAMTRAVLDERFKFTAHYETREEPAFDLVLARGDGRLGPSLTVSEIDCAVLIAEQRAKAEAARAAGEKPPPLPTIPTMPTIPTGPIAPCSMRMSGPRLEGHMNIASLAGLLRGRAGRIVVDKTGLPGYYNVLLVAAAAPASLSAADAAGAASAADAPSVFTAVQEQLGLKLESSKTTVNVLVVDHVERPTDN
jgi:uncharacterized protein (TIGR03435 family)